MGKYSERSELKIGSQNYKIREWLETGRSITPREAQDMFNCWRLASRITDLKKTGMDIVTEIKYTADGVKYALYHL